MYRRSKAAQAQSETFEGLELSRTWLKNYDDNLKELKYLEEKVRQIRERLEFMYGRSDLQIVKSANKVYESRQNLLHETFDDLDGIKKRMKLLAKEQEEIMALVDCSVVRDCSLVIRSYHELGLSFSQIGDLYHMGRSTANRRYWTGMHALEKALANNSNMAA